MWGQAIAILAAGQALGMPSFATRVEVARPVVELGDVLDLVALPSTLRRRAATLEIAHFRPEQAFLVMTSQDLTARARAQMPVLGPWLASAPVVMVSIRRRSSPHRDQAQQRPCLTAIRAVLAGDFPTAADFQPGACDANSQVRTAFRYDRRVHTVRTEHDLAPGDIVQAPPPSTLAAVRPTERLYLTAHVGPVTVTREVQAIQPAPAGGALFVKAEDGAIFAAPAPEKAQ